MRDKIPAEIEGRRVVNSGLPGTPNGRFILTCPETGRTLRVIASDGTGWRGECGGDKLPGEPWEHVSVSAEHGLLPRWPEMQWVKTLFWRDDETTVQFHPPDSEYVNINEVLHIWKPPYPIPLPPKEAL